MVRRYQLNMIAHFRRQFCKYGVNEKLSSATTTGTPSAASINFQNIPSPKGLPIVGSNLALIAAGGAPYLHKYVDKRHKQFGPIFRDKISSANLIFLSDPEYMRQVFAQEGRYPHHIVPEAWIIYNKVYQCARGLLFMEGEEWMHYRRIMNKHLLKGNHFEWIQEACQTSSDEIIERWKKFGRAQPGIVPKIETELYRWSLNSMVAILLGKDLYLSRHKELDHVLEKLADVVHIIFERSIKMQILPASFAYKFNLPAWKNYVKSVDETMLLASSLVSSLLRDLPRNEGLLSKLRWDDNLTDTEIAKLVTDLILAAGDTTVNTMLWSLYSIAINGDVQDQLRDASSLTYAKNAVKESLRMYPVAIFLNRILTKEARVAGYSVPAGSVMLFSAYTHGRDPKYFSDPDRFYPDRWLRDKSETTRMFMPFALGARSCVGRKIAEMQMQTLLPDLVRHFKIDLMNVKPIEIILKMVAVPSQPLRLKLTAL